MLAGNRCAYRQTFMDTLRRIEQEPVRFSVSLQPHKVSAADEIPAEVAFSVHRLRKRESQFLPSIDLRGEVQIKGLSLGLQF